ncbi:hypothetical protein EVAR_80658_1 [Eumeta japonica]|uniref:Uncharacterized protein n=1 Tax=Eumeta variegata TaxID=151549 RepID=A0A4C1U3G3_EUMVA|nr:hypothetical protein EVAR_80658_1 [Eumeta japonica]
MFLAYFMLLNPPHVTFLMNELPIGTYTVTDWSNFIREVLEYWVIRNSPTKLGGIDKIVEIDEAKFGKRKYNRGRIVDGEWVFSELERGIKKVFMELVPDKNTNMLLQIIKKKIEPGTTIMISTFECESPHKLRGSRLWGLHSKYRTNVARCSIYHPQAPKRKLNPKSNSKQGPRPLRPHRAERPRARSPQTCMRNSESNVQVNAQNFICRTIVDPQLQNSLKEISLETEITAPDGMNWKVGTMNCALPGRRGQQNLFKDHTGPTPYAKRNVDETCNTAWRLMIDEKI